MRVVVIINRIELFQDEGHVNKLVWREYNTVQENCLKLRYEPSQKELIKKIKGS